MATCVMAWQRAIVFVVVALLSTPLTAQRECPCPDELAQVCGNNSVTYINPCLAECANITSYTDGACPEIPDGGCPVNSTMSSTPGMCLCSHDRVCAGDKGCVNPMQGDTRIGLAPVGCDTCTCELPVSCPDDTIMNDNGHCECPWGAICQGNPTLCGLRDEGNNTIYGFWVPPCHFCSCLQVYTSTTTFTPLTTVTAAPTCQTHSQCSNETEYCSDTNTCAPCRFCETLDDAVDGSCPGHCENVTTTQNPTTTGEHGICPLFQTSATCFGSCQWVDDACISVPTTTTTTVTTTTTTTATTTTATTTSTTATTTTSTATATTTALQVCLLGTFRSAGSGLCEAWHTCPDGSFQTAAPTALSDRACSPVVVEVGDAAPAGFEYVFGEIGLLGLDDVTGVSREVFLAALLRAYANRQPRGAAIISSSVRSRRSLLASIAQVTYVVEVDETTADTGLPDLSTFETLLKEEADDFGDSAAFANVQGLFVRKSTTESTTSSNDDDDSSFGLGYIIAAGLGGVVLIVLVSLAVWHFCFPPERETWSLDDDVAARSESVRVARYTGQDEPAASETIKLQTIRPKGSVYISPYSTTA